MNTPLHNSLFRIVYTFPKKELNKAAFSTEKKLILGKKNIGSLYINGETLYAASHDGKLFKISMRNFEIESLIKDVHKKMFDCAGIYEDMLVGENGLKHEKS